MRETCDAILAFGVCAVYGGPQGSGYAHSLGELEDAVFRHNPTTHTTLVPDRGVPRLLPELLPLDAEVQEMAEARPGRKLVDGYQRLLSCLDGLHLVNRLYC